MSPNPEPKEEKPHLSDRDFLKLMAAAAGAITTALLPLGQALAKADKKIAEEEQPKSKYWNPKAENRFCDLFGFPRKDFPWLFTRWVTHFLDEDSAKEISEQQIPLVVFESSPRGCAALMSNDIMGEPVQNPKRPGIGGRPEDALISREFFQRVPQTGRMFIPIDVDISWSKFGFDASKLDVAPSDTLPISPDKMINYLHVALMGAEAILAIAAAGASALKGSDKAAGGSIIGGILAEGYTIWDGYDFNRTSEQEGSKALASIMDTDAALSERWNIERLKNFFINFDEYLIGIRNIMMAQQLKRAIALYAPNPATEKIFAGAGNGHSGMWNKIYDEWSGTNEQKIEIYATRIFEDTLGYLNEIIKRVGNADAAKLAEYFGRFTMLFGDTQIAGTRRNGDGSISPTQLLALEPPIEEKLLIPDSPRTILLRTLTKFLYRENDKGLLRDENKMEILTNLWLVSMKQCYDETMALQRQGALWGESKDGNMLAPTDHVAEIAKNLMDKNQYVFLQFTLACLDRSIAESDKQNKLAELTFQQTIVTEETGDLILGGVEWYGGMLPFVRKFTPSLRDRRDEGSTAAYIKPEEIIAQDGIMLPSGVLVPVGEPMRYARISIDERAPISDCHTTLVLHREAGQPIEAIRSKNSVERDNADLYCLISMVGDPGINLTDILLVP